MPSQGPNKKDYAQKTDEAAVKTALGWESKSKLVNGKETVTWTHSGGLGYLCPIPYGQFKSKLNVKDKKTVQNYWYGIESNGKWPKDLLGFEAWCGMTNFDDSKPDGGMAFQRLMLQVLGHQTSQVPDSTELQFESMWDADACTYGEMFNTNEGEYEFETQPPDLWFEALQGNGSILGGVFVNDWESTGAHLSAHARPLYLPAKGKKGKMSQSMGMMLGNHSNNKQPVISPGNAFIPNSNHYDIYSKHDWAVQGMLQTGSAGRGGHSGSQTLGQGLVSPGVDKVASQQCWEVTGLEPGEDSPCMLMQNSLAAVYGLYYYNDCNNATYNWSVQETVQETTPPTTFQIRFRCPNPKYGPAEWYKKSGGEALESNGTNQASGVRNLFVREPLNAKNRTFLDRYVPDKVRSMNIGRVGTATAIPNSLGRRSHTHVGGTHGKNNDTENKFVVPKVQRISQHPTSHPLISPWAYIVNNDDTMQVAPFWNKGYDGEAQSSWHGLKAQSKRSFTRGEQFRASDIMVAGEMINDVAFGFRISQAFLLYPHYNDGSPVDRNWAVKAEPVRYMTEPKWKANPTVQVIKPLASHVLDWDDWQQGNMTDEEWRKDWRGKLLATPAPQAPAPARSNAAGKQPMHPRPPPRTTQAQTTQPSFVAPPPGGGATNGSISVERQTERVDEGGIDEGAGDDFMDDGGEQQLPGQTMGTNQTAERESIAQTQMERDTVTANFGIPGMSLAETLKECIGRKLGPGDKGYEANFDKLADWSSMEFTDAEIGRLMKSKGKVKTSRMVLLETALNHCELFNAGLEEGSTKRGREAQCHWPSARHSPWSHHDCYEPATIEYDTTLMDQEKIDDYKHRYGSDANLYLQSADTVKRITGVTINWGARKPLLQNKLNHNDTRSLLNYARILAIYYSPDGVGKWTFKQKQLGMRNGLGHAKNTRQNKQEVIPRPHKGRIQNWVEKWPAVFSGDPQTLGRPLITCLKSYVCDRDVTSDGALPKCLEDQGNWQEKLSMLGTDMTVAQWITTPWHLEHLPYQRQYAVFRDGECYSEGCKRCSRTFYEYAYHMYADRTSKPGTFGYPNDLWFHPQNKDLAPLPLHDPIFWSQEGSWDTMQFKDPGDHTQRAQGGQTLGAQRGKRNRKKALPTASLQEAQMAEVEEVDVQREFEDYTGGNMAWSTFLLDPNRLDSADRTRTHVTSRGIMTFRRYINQAYSDSQTDDRLEVYGTNAQTYYTGVNQGYMLSARNKVTFGDVEYRVTRSHKYGNVCRDCASLLDRAPGLFVRNNRYQFDGGLVNGNSDAVEGAVTDYWLLLFGKLGIADDLDAFLMKDKTSRLSKLPATEQAGWDTAFDDAANLLASKLNEKHRFPENWTRLVDKPTIHIQGTVTKSTDQTIPDIEEAIKDLNKLLNGVDPSTLNLQNPKLRDFVRDAERNFMHNEAFATIDHTKQFDSDLKRVEYRNCIIKWTPRAGQGVLTWLNAPGLDSNITYDMQQDVRLIGEELPTTRMKKFGALTIARYINEAPSQPMVFYNCLITDQFDPDVMDQSAADVHSGIAQHLRTPMYRMEVYLNTRVGVGGSARQPTDEDPRRSKPTQWKGDGFVCLKPTDDRQIWRVHPAQGVDATGRAEKQVRAMRQSRIFITYSLHRPISGDDQGRVILESMADALYELFGTDKWLSEMIVFGKMLKSFKVGSQREDNVSKSTWGIINKTNKDAAMGSFYGSKDESMVQTSYTYDTYETHIDKLEVDGGCEIGPKMGHPHFHLILTMNHFSYVQFDYFKMNTFLEIMFKGLRTFHNWGPTPEKPLGRFYLGAEGDPFYGDNENPYVDIKLYPQDNWKEILAAYVRKNAIPSIIEVESTRRQVGTAAWRRGYAAGADVMSSEFQGEHVAAEGMGGSDWQRGYNGRRGGGSQ